MANASHCSQRYRKGGGKREKKVGNSKRNTRANHDRCMPPSAQKPHSRRQSSFRVYRRFVCPVAASGVAKTTTTTQPICRKECNKIYKNDRIGIIVNAPVTGTLAHLLIAEGHAVAIPEGNLPCRRAFVNIGAWILRGELLEARTARERGTKRIQRD